MDNPEDFRVGTRVLIGESTEVYIVASRPHTFCGVVCVDLKDARKGRFKGTYNIKNLKIIQEESKHVR